jgi:PEP-CTERM motif
MNFSRLSSVLAVLLLCAAVPLRANSIHGTKGASNQGPESLANFGPQDGGPAISGIPTTLFINNNVDPSETLDLFVLPGFSSGSIFTLTFNTANAAYGIFNCNNGTSNQAVSAIGETLVGPCTVGTDNTNFVNFVDGATSATVQFNGAAGAPSTFVFYAEDGQLTSITTGSGTTQVPEPGTFALVGVGLIGLWMFRRRSASAEVTA